MVDLTWCDRIIISNVPNIFFDDPQMHSEFDKHLKNIVPSIVNNIIYLKGLNKIIIYIDSNDMNKFNTPLQYTLELAHYEYKGYQLNYRWDDCNYHRRNTKLSKNLQVPKPNNLFLLSPPVSPPNGWEPIDEASPTPANLAITIDGLELDSRLAGTTLQPGYSLTILQQKNDQPAIIIENVEYDHQTNATNTIQPDITFVKAFHP